MIEVLHAFATKNVVELLVKQNTEYTESVVDVNLHVQFFELFFEVIYPSLQTIIRYTNVSWCSKE